MTENGGKDVSEEGEDICEATLALERLRKFSTTLCHTSDPSTSGTVSTSEEIESIEEDFYSIKNIPRPNEPPPKLDSSSCKIFLPLPNENTISSTISTDSAPPQYFRVPPSYSTVMKMGPAPDKKVIDMNSSQILARVPPPSYAEVEGILSDLPRQESSVSFGPDPVYMMCPHCSAIVITETYRVRSTFTHLTALALCIFGCWPCCLLPYFMDSCQNTYHHCPVCNYFFGSYNPW